MTDCSPHTEGKGKGGKTAKLHWAQEQDNTNMSSELVTDQNWRAAKKEITV